MAEVHPGHLLPGAQRKEEEELLIKGSTTTLRITCYF
jgi:hypothetical protein